ncbi:MAG: TetR/AcrR family transcriptional regulator, partial [Acidimicrobiales bacterium]
MTTTRDRLLAATNELFRRQGFNGTSMSEITKASGAPTGSLYHFFPGGKDELATAVLTESGASYRALFELIAADAPETHPDYFGGGTYRHLDAKPLDYDSDHNFKLNVWSYDWPRY